MTERNGKWYTLKMMTFTLVLLVCLAMQEVVAYAEVSARNCTAYVNADTKLNLRREPQGEIIGKLPRGETVTILSEIDRNGYYHIRVDKTGLECYAYGEYLTVLYENKTQETTNNTVKNENYSSQIEKDELEGKILVVVSQKQLNMRKKANKNAERIKYLEYGDKLKAISGKVKNGYILVRDLQDGKVGYVDIDYVIWEDEYMDTKQCCQDSQCKCNKR